MHDGRTGPEFEPGHEAEARPLALPKQAAPSLQQPPIQAEVRCVACSYDLRGSAVGGNCPECGTPVIRSLAVGANSEPHSGMAIIALVLGIWSLVLSCMSTFPPVLLCLTMVPLGPIGLVFAIVIAAAGIVCSKMARRDPAGGPVNAPSLRDARLGMILSIIGGIIALIGIVVIIVLRTT